MFRRRRFGGFRRRKGSRILTRQFASFNTQVNVVANGSVLVEPFIKMDTILGDSLDSVVKSVNIIRIKYWSELMNSVSGTAAAPMLISEAVYAYDMGSGSSTPFVIPFGATNQLSATVPDSQIPMRFFGRRYRWVSDGSPVGSLVLGGSSSMGNQAGNVGDGAWTMKVRRKLSVSDAVVVHLDLELPGSGTAAASTWLWSFVCLLYYSVTV